MGKIKNERIYKPNSFYHIYNRGNRKAKIFHQEKDYMIFRNLLYRYIKKTHIILVVYCFMPTHYHMILKCQNDWHEIPKFMQKFMTAYAVYFNRRYMNVGRVFQGPFQVKILERRKDLNREIIYIKNNPKTDKLVKEGERYPWLYIKNEKHVNRGQA